MFRNRIEAGKILAKKLKKYANQAGVVLAVPRGGVPVAYAVAKELGFPVEVILSKKIGHPSNKEYAIGAATMSDYFVVPGEDVSETYIKSEVDKVQARLREMNTRFMGDRQPIDLHGKTVIVVDDGIATGNTLLGTVNILRRKNPSSIVIAAPVASGSAVQKLSAEVDEVVTVLIPELFYGVGAFYEDFKQVEDEEVVYYLNELRKWENQERKTVSG